MNVELMIGMENSAQELFLKVRHIVLIMVRHKSDTLNYSDCYDTGGRQIQPGGTWENIQFRFKCIKASQDIMFFYITRNKI